MSPSPEGADGTDAAVIAARKAGETFWGGAWSSKLLEKPVFEMRKAKQKQLVWSRMDDQLIKTEIG